MNKQELKKIFTTISFMDPKAKFATDESLLDFQLDIWLKVIGKYSFEIAQNAVVAHYTETIWQPGPADILKHIIQMENAERRKAVEAEKEYQKIEYNRKYQASQEEIARLKLDPDYQELRDVFVLEYTKQFPETNFLYENPEAIDNNIIFHRNFGFYHFEHPKMGLKEIEPGKFIPATTNLLEDKTPHELARQQRQDLIDKWKSDEIRTRKANDPDRSIVSIVEEVAKEAKDRFKDINRLVDLLPPPE